MLATFWHEYLYQPLLNVLFILYDRTAGENLGVAIIELTVLMRIALLPFSVLSERKRGALEALSSQITDVDRHFKNDPVRKRAETRKLLKRHRVSPWAKFVVLGVQVLVFVLIYQVFIGGLQSEKLVDLYASVRRPDFVNTMFAGFNIAKRHLGWSIAVGVGLFVEILFMQRGERHRVVAREVAYRYIFPLAVTVILAQLPMVKSLFVMTSMAFSGLLFGARRAFAK
ncbi:YidC/Oxa1 family membrane protein insertase [Candidatus Uhrbacteria bacterium]|nr:YidC/Oxa1 family membrane protein insertase [Candidatus Uhrbacteria bacterium]